MMNASIVSMKDAKLPVSYERAREALARCYELDEVKDWKDKAAAIASYAKQAEDYTLLDTAKRIMGRAVRRMGEILREVEPKPGARTDKEPCAGNGTRSVSRKSIAEEAGLSKRQKDDALRVAAIPEAKFERLIEAAKPPTVTELAKIGTKPKAVVIDHLQGRSPEDFNASIRGRGAMMRMAEACDELDPRIVVRNANDDNIPKMKLWAKTIAKWIAKVETELEKLK